MTDSNAWYALPRDLGELIDKDQCDPSDPMLILSQLEKMRLLGRGDVGRVFLVRHKTENTLYALKVLAKEDMILRNKVKRVLTEREILATTDHPFIVSLHASFAADDKLFFMMEYCAGGEFFRMLQKQPGKRLIEQHARFYAAEVFLALEYLHMMGFIYRDLKPENILLHETGHIRLTDFDLSALSAANPQRLAKNANASQLNSFVGTEEYISPEVIQGYGQSSSVDWWTFGILLFEILTGTTPFKGKTMEETFENVRLGELKFPKGDGAPELSKSAKDLIRKLLNPDPKKRLGAGPEGSLEIRKHPWFKGVQWALIRNEQPPLIPTVCDPMGTEVFPKLKDDTDTPTTAVARSLSRTSSMGNSNELDESFKEFGFKCAGDYHHRKNMYGAEKNCSLKESVL
eukprot:ANDGO_07845.mRNA.1 Flippase kinase 1